MVPGACRGAWAAPLPAERGVCFCFTAAAMGNRIFTGPALRLTTSPKPGTLSGASPSLGLVHLGQPAGSCHLVPSAPPTPAWLRDPSLCCSQAETHGRDQRPYYSDGPRREGDLLKVSNQEVALPRLHPGSSDGPTSVAWGWRHGQHLITAQAIHLVRGTPPLDSTTLVLKNSFSMSDVEKFCDEGDRLLCESAV